MCAADGTGRVLMSIAIHVTLTKNGLRIRNRMFRKFIQCAMLRHSSDITIHFNYLDDVRLQFERTGKFQSRSYIT